MSTCPPKNKKSRHCRVSMARLRNNVFRAAKDWEEIFGRKCGLTNLHGETCDELARNVKAFLSSTVSSDVLEQMAFQSIKKQLPASCKCQKTGLLEKLVDNLSTPPGQLPFGYLAFVRSLTKELFRKDWDRSYSSFCQTTTAGIKSTNSGDGYMSQIDFWSHRHAEYIGKTLGDIPFTESDFDISADLIVVQSAGKPRPLTKFSGSAMLLKPLHKTIYSHMSSYKWLLRGDVDSEKLKKAGFSGEGYLTSGDYKSATDNLHISVARAILDEILKSSSAIPADVRDYAQKILLPELKFGDFEFVPAKGQMMGSYLSFPLLCLQNYCAFKYAEKIFRRKFRVKPRLPVLINGDDILFESDKLFSSHWMSLVGSLGLEVERTKTSVLKHEGSINSTPVRFSNGELVVDPVLRFGMLRKVEYPTELGRTFSSFLKGQTGKVRYNAAKVFFRRHIMSFHGHSADELSFRGPLALRMSKIFGVAPVARQQKAALPPVIHNVVFNSSLVEFLPPSSIKNFQLENASEMACWKWSLDMKSFSGRAQIRWCLRNTKFSYFHINDLSPLRPGEVKSLFTHHTQEKTVPVMKTIVDLYNLNHTNEDLPQYPWWERASGTAPASDKDLSLLHEVRVMPQPDVVWGAVRLRSEMNRTRRAQFRSIGA